MIDRKVHFNAVLALVESHLPSARIVDQNIKRSVRFFKAVCEINDAFEG